jgi:rod shape-determining protein MreD
MSGSTDRTVEVFRVHPATLGVSILVAVLLQVLLPLKLPLARLMDLPLLVTIYFALVRRNRIFGIGLGTGVGLVQDALSHSYIGVFGMVKALVGYLAASSSVRFELESLPTRAVMMAIFVFVHSVCLAGLQHVLLESHPPFRLLGMASGLMVNVALGLIVFQVLDRFRHPA